MEMLKIYLLDRSLKITPSELQPHLSGASKLIMSKSQNYHYSTVKNSDSDKYFLHVKNSDRDRTECVVSVSNTVWLYHHVFSGPFY